MPQRCSSRRQFLLRSAQLGLGVGAAALAAVGPGGSHSTASEQTGRRVLIEDVLDPRAQRAAGRTAQPSGVSGILSASRPFTHLGVHWVGPAGLPVGLQTSHDGLAWTPWRPLMLERAAGDAPHAPNENFAALSGAPRHRFIRYRLGDGGDAAGDLTVTCLNSLDGPRVSSTVGTRRGSPLAQGGNPQTQLEIARAHADGADFRQRIVTREQWEADESVRFGPDGDELWPRAYVAPRMVVVHHTATDTAYTDAAAEVRAIYAYHAVTQGFGDIGYNGLIDRDGRMYEGRIGRDDDPSRHFHRDVLSHAVVAGHTFDYNYGSVGHALLGNFQEDRPAEAMLDALEDLLMFEHARYQVDPRRTIDFSRSSRLWRYDLVSMPGHRDCTNTECPGENVYPLLSELRTVVAERLDAGPTPFRAIVEGPERRNVWLGVDSAAYAWTGTPPYDCVYEGFQRQLGEDAVAYHTGYTPLGMAEHIVTSQQSVNFRLPAPGQYTLHLRPNGRPFADIRTVLADRHVVRDNADDSGIEREGEWTRSRNVLQFYGTDYELAEPGSGARFSWQLAPREAGTYLVQACWAAGTDRSRAAPYSLGALGGPNQTVHADQTINGGMWVDLGSLNLEVEQPALVTLSATTDGIVIADAVRLLAADD